MERKISFHVETCEGGDHQILQLHVDRQLLDYVAHENALGADDEGADRGGMELRLGTGTCEHVAVEHIC